MSDNRYEPSGAASQPDVVAALRAERDAAQADLAALRGLMEAMCENMTDGIALFDAGRRLVHINRAAREFLDIGTVSDGTTAETILAAREAGGDEAIVDGRVLSIDERIALIFAPHGSRFERRLGDDRRAEIMFKPLSNGATLCTCRDITELKRRQVELRTALDRLANANRLTTTVLETMMDGVALFDAERRLSYVNPALTSHMVLPGAEPLRLGMTMEEIAQARIAAGEDVLENEVALTAEQRAALALEPGGNRFTRRLATGRYVEFLFRPVGDGRTLGVYRDVTESRLRQKELKQAYDEARKARELMEAVLGSMKDGVALFGPNKVLYCNKALAGLFDFAGGIEPCSMDLVDVMRRLEASGDRMVEGGEDVSAEERARRVLAGSPENYERQLPSGRHIEYRFERLSDGRTVGHYRDITARKERERELERTRDELLDAQRLMTTVLEGMTDGATLFDAGRRLVFANKVVREALSPAGPGVLEVGRTMEDIVRDQLAAGDLAVEDGLGTTVEERVERVFDPGGCRYEREFLSGRHVEVTFRPVGDGRTLGFYRDITDLKQRQLELERARDEVARTQELMAAVLKGLPVGVSLFDAERYLVYSNRPLNPKALSLPGDAPIEKFRLDEVIRAQIASGDHLFGDDGRPLTFEQRLARTLDPRGSRSERRMPNGRYVEFSFRPLPSGHTLSVYRDITELKQRQAELEQARDEVAAAHKLTVTILDSMTDGFSLFLADGRVAFMNHTVRREFGISEEKARDLTLQELVRMQAEAGDQVVVDGRVLSVEERIARILDPAGCQFERILPSGTHVEFNFRPVGDGRTLGIYRNITDLKRRQTDLELERDRTAAARKLMSTVLDGMTDGVALFDAEQRLALFSRGARKIFGFPSDSFGQGKKVVDLLRAEVAAGDVMIMDGKVLSIEDRMALIFDPNGSRFERELPGGRHIEYTHMPLKDGSTLALYRNITELKRRQSELESARDAAEAANQAKSTFLATISHEIRTPMNGVIGTAELLEREALDDRQKRLVRTVRTSATALLRIIDDVLDFSKIEAGRMEFEEAPFLLRGIVEGTGDTLSVQAERKGLAITTTIEPGTPDHLIGDATRVRQILFNLIGNAIKFTDAGEIHVHVRTLSRTADRVRLALSVRDTGIGLSQAQAARLFQPFSQADSSTTRRFGGTGLGLSIVRRLAELMEGEVAIDSIPGKGSTFTVTLELGLGEGPFADTAAPMPAAGGMTAGRVLAIDDYPINLEVLTGQLEILGVDVDTAADGIEALTKWREQPYAMVLTDIHMPDMDGFELTRQIRAEEAIHPTARRTPIVALTANALKGEAERCLAAGMDGYLTKPLTLDRLREAIDRWMGTATAAAASDAAGSSEGPIDRAVVSRMFGDNPAMIDRVLRRFRDAGGRLVAEIGDAAGDVGRLADLAHKIKGAARAAGAVRLGDLAAALEQSGSAADAAAVHSEWARVAEALRDSS